MYLYTVHTFECLRLDPNVFIPACAFLQSHLCLCLCLYPCIMHMLVCMSLHAHMDVNIHAYVFVCITSHVSPYMHTLYLCAHAGVYICVCQHVCMHVYIHIYKFVSRSSPV